MSNIQGKESFLRSEKAQDIKQQLRGMVDNDLYSTRSSYSTDVERYPDSLIPFVDKHIKYLSDHLNVNTDHYLANLRLITRVSR